MTDEITEKPDRYGRVLRRVKIAPLYVELRERPAESFEELLSGSG